MPHIHESSRLYSFADTKPPGPGWETVTVERFNTLRASGWEPTENESLGPWRVSKDTIITRITEAGKLAEARTLHGAQTAADKWLFDQTAWFWNTNTRMRGFCTALGLDPDVIMAPDEFL